MQDWNEWWQSALGQYVIEREQEYFDRTVANLFGYHAVQIGMSQFDFLRANRMPHHFHLGREVGAELCCDPTQVPLETSSVDLVVLPHVLDTSEHPHQVLREAERVLVPEGQIVVAGFNPWSLWGAKRYWARRSGAPWSANFVSLPRIKDWLELLGFEARATQLAGYAPPFSQRHWLERFSFVEDAGHRWWPVAGGVYFLHATKRVRGMRLITPAWQQIQLRARLAALAEKNGAGAAARSIEQRSKSS